MKSAAGSSFWKETLHFRKPDDKLLLLFTSGSHSDQTENKKSTKIDHFTLCMLRNHRRFFFNIIDRLYSHMDRRTGATVAKLTHAFIYLKPNQWRWSRTLFRVRPGIQGLLFWRYEDTFQTEAEKKKTLQLENLEMRVNLVEMKPAAPCLSFSLRLSGGLTGFWRF